MDIQNIIAVILAIVAASWLGYKYIIVPLLKAKEPSERCNGDCKCGS